MYIRDVIKKKRNNQELTEQEIKFFIQSYFNEEISESQAGALMTTMYMKGLNESEISYMVQEMAKTGDQLECYRLSKRLTDIHAIGGISDKVILTLLAVLDALDVPTAKVTGRELGMEDRLMSIPGYKLEHNMDEFKEKIESGSTPIMKYEKTVAAAEQKMYTLRREVACENNEELIATSIMSQKVAIGFSNIFFEITYGKNAYVKDLAKAKILAKYLIKIGEKIGKNVGCCATRMNEPVGRCFGNILEIKEIYNFLKGQYTSDFYEEVLTFGSIILRISGISGNESKNRKRIMEVIENKDALASFEKMIKEHGGDLSVLKEEVNPRYIVPITAKRSGYIEEIDVNKLRMLSIYLNAIRRNEEDMLDIGAGIVINRKVGDYIKAGEQLGLVYTNDELKLEHAMEKSLEMFELTENKVKKTNRVSFSI